MRITKLSTFSVCFALLLAFSLSHAKPDKGDPKKPDEPSVFKPIQITGDLTKDDENDPKLMQPGKKYPVKLNKDKTYVIEMTTKDFDPFLRLLDKANKELAEDDDSGGGLNSHHLFGDDRRRSPCRRCHVRRRGRQVRLKVRELDIKGEAKAREFPKAGFEHAGELGENDMTDLCKRPRSSASNSRRISRICLRLRAAISIASFTSSMPRVGC